MTITSRQRIRQPRVTAAQEEIQTLVGAIAQHRRRACSTKLLEGELRAARSRLSSLVAQGRISRRTEQ